MPGSWVCPAAGGPQVEFASYLGVPLGVIPCSLYHVPRTLRPVQRLNCFGHWWWVTAMSASHGIPKSTTLKIISESRGVTVSDGAEGPTGRRRQQSLLGVQAEFLVPVRRVCPHIQRRREWRRLPCSGGCAPVSVQVQRSFLPRVMARKNPFGLSSPCSFRCS